MSNTKFCNESPLYTYDNYANVNKVDNTYQWQKCKDKVKHNLHNFERIYNEKCGCKLNDDNVKK